MSLLDCVGDLGAILADAFITLGLALGVVVLPILPLFWLFFKLLDSTRLGEGGKIAGGVVLALIAITWVAVSMSVLKCMGY